MVVADLRGAVPGRVSRGLEDLVRARVRTVTDVVAVGARTGDPDPVTEALAAHVFGEDAFRHRGAADVAGAHESDVNHARVTPSPSGSG
ncbi:hypothetical protein RE0356_29630 [Prescottella equi]|nr:hypothetical protein RE0356_29630 [Prescottella equi]